jgi:hypothetical protein
VVQQLLGALPLQGGAVTLLFSRLEPASAVRTPCETCGDLVGPLDWCRCDAPTRLYSPPVRIDEERLVIIGDPFAGRPVAATRT